MLNNNNKFINKIIRMLGYGGMLALLGCTSHVTKEDVGALAGGIGGGYAGHALTSGSTLGTIGGALGGAYIGQQVAKDIN